MRSLPVALLSQACQIYLELAYPQGPSGIPPRALAFWHLDPALPLDEVVPPAPLSAQIGKREGDSGYVFRLGCEKFPYMKLKVMDLWVQEAWNWVFAVDTHDRSFTPPADSPEADHWEAILAHNQVLKEQIEAAWLEHGLQTQTSILRRSLERSHI